MNKENILEIKNLYKKKSGHIILNDISFECRRAEITGVVGPNGAGKSSLFKVLMGYWKKDSGDILINGGNIWGGNKNINGMIEEPVLYPYLTVKENIDYFSLLYGVNGNRSEINKYIELLKIDKYEKVLGKQLSIGMRQRVGILQALISNSQVIILDEPTNGLDVMGVEEVREILKECKNTGRTILVSSHILEEINEICDQVLIMKDGKIIDRVDNSYITKEKLQKYFK